MDAIPSPSHPTKRNRVHLNVAAIVTRRSQPTEAVITRMDGRATTTAAVVVEAIVRLWETPVGFATLATLTYVMSVNHIRLKMMME
jgi:hypothetical protein